MPTAIRTAASFEKLAPGLPSRCGRPEAGTALREGPLLQSVEFLRLVANLARAAELLRDSHDLVSRDELHSHHSQHQIKAR